MNSNPYVSAPVLETEHFRLRLVTMEDARDLLDCYSDEVAQPFFNADACTGDFRIATEEQMRDCIQAWLGCYARQEFVRWSILDRESGRAVGTVEMFGVVGVYGQPRGILRVDVASRYERAALLGELFSLCAARLFDLFDVDCMVVKAVPEAEQRRLALKAAGFEPYDFPGRQHYFARQKQ